MHRYYNAAAGKDVRRTQDRSIAMTIRHRNNERIAIFYEHSEWFRPLFAELDRRGIQYDRLLAYDHHFDPYQTGVPYSLVVNRMSPSAYLRGHEQSIFYTLEYMAYLKEIGANVLNGYDAYLYEFSKARQLRLLDRLGLPHPRARIINHASQAPAAAEGLRFPVIIKPNIGGSGAKIMRFDSPHSLRAGAEAGTIDLGIDHTALLQEYLPAEDNSIVRVEILDGGFLYAIRLRLTTDEFNLCPADYCQTTKPQADLTGNCISNRNALVEGYTPPAHIIADVKRIISAANIEVGGVEYLINERDGGVYYYDINALSNFVANAPEVIGFDPLPQLVDYLLVRAEMQIRAAV